MVCIKDHYLSFNKILLLAIGLWPYERSKFAQYQFIFISAILMETIIFQLTVFITSSFNIDLIINVLCTTCLFAIAEIKYVLFNVHINTMKKLLIQFQYIYDELKDEHEIAIAEKYYYIARRYTSILTIFIVCSIFIVFITQFWTDIIDVVLQINISRSRTSLLTTEYFVDQKQYFYFILLHTSITFSIAMFITIAIGTIFITFFQCICGMFKISSYRIEHALDIDKLKNSVGNINHVFKRIICAVDIQRQAINLSIFLVNKLETMMCSLIICGVISLSLNLFRIFQIFSGDNIIDIMPYFAYTALLILYMFIANYLGQELTDHNKEVFLAAYNIRWYITPVQIQKLILFLLQRGVRDFNVNVGKLFVPSLESFAMLVKTSVSYFTVVYATR
ncbi:hypothetical protein HN011_004410 [Eciton burchellii]|nr:hypothetical protein HN011_004410 [Eciton burchellii]